MHQLASFATVEWYERAADLVDGVAGESADAVVTDLRDEDGRSIAPTIVELAAMRPRLPIIIHTRIDRAAIDRLLATFTLGLRMECVVRPFARLEPTIRRMLAPKYRPGVAPLLLHHFMPHVPAALRTFVVLAILTAPERRTVEELARWCRMSPKTIGRRLRRAGWPGALVVVQSFAALDVTWLMTEYGWSARQVRKVRSFSHPSGVTRLLTTYAGTRPSTLMEDGGFPAALARVTATLLPR